MKRIAFFGGTFNPPHMGHVKMLEQVQKRLQFDRIDVLPAAMPPHKELALAVPFEHRMHMCRLAFRNIPNVTVNNFENRRTERSYTYETLRRLREQEADGRFYFITGADAYFAFPQWHRWKELFELACFIVTKRPGYEWTGCQQVDAVAAQSREGLILLSVEALDVSSTEVREALLRGEQPLHLSTEVCAYIRRHKLYQNKGEAEHGKTLS